jgi:type IV pilus assembly protein PilA
VKGKIQQGFTLIELMIVIAIIGILAAIAIPAYQDYTVRSQVSEGIALASATKAAVAEFYSARGTWPTDSATGAATDAFSWTATTQPKSKYVTGITVEDGTIVIAYGGDINPRATAGGLNKLTLRPGATANGDINWSCGYATYPPATVTVQNTAPTTTTNILGKFLPSTCRAGT